MTTTVRINTDTGEVVTTPEAIHAAAQAMRYPVPSDASFVDGGEEVDFQAADDLEEIADALMDREELHLGHLNDRKLAMLWRRAGGKSKGQPVLGKCQKPSGLLKHFSGQDFVIWLAADHCRDYQFTRQQVEALLFSQLCCAWVNEEGEPEILAPDVVGFRAEIEHFGFWRFDLQQAADTFQLRLAMGDA